MGIFNFSKNAGNAIFGAKNPNADDIKTLIIEWLERQKSRVENLIVKYDSGLVTLCGNCDTVKTKEKAILVAGNIEGVERVDASELLAPQPAPPVQETTRTVAAPTQPAPAPQAKPTATPTAPPAAPQAKPAPTTAPQPEATQSADSSVFYTIQKGDTLSKVSKQFYGDPNKYRYIVEENSGVIEDADKIYPGQTIRIPPLPA